MFALRGANDLPNGRCGISRPLSHWSKMVSNSIEQVPTGRYTVSTRSYVVTESNGSRDCDHVPNDLLLLLRENARDDRVR
jgi:hypothetical protein